MKAGLFGGGWEDYLDALSEAFDRHAAENAPPHPFGASVDAILTGYPDDAGSLPASPPGPVERASDFANGVYVYGGANGDSFAQFRDVTQPLAGNFAPNSGMAHAPGESPALIAPVSYSAPSDSHPSSKINSGRLGVQSGLQFPQDNQGSSSSNSASHIPRGEALALPGRAVPGHADPSVWQSKAMRDASVRATGDHFWAPDNFVDKVNECPTHAGPDADACIDIDTDGEIKTWYNHPAYDPLDLVVKEGINAHEDKHKSQLQAYLHWWEPTWMSRGLKALNYYIDPGKFEIPAYQAEIDKLQRHLDQHPEDPKYDAIKARIRDRQLQIERYRKL